MQKELAKINLISSPVMTFLTGNSGFYGSNIFLNQNIAYAFPDMFHKRSVCINIFFLQKSFKCSSKLDLVFQWKHTGGKLNLMHFAPITLANSEYSYVTTVIMPIFVRNTFVKKIKQNIILLNYSLRYFLFPFSSILLKINFRDIMWKKWIVLNDHED